MRNPTPPSSPFLKFIFLLGSTSLLVTGCASPFRGEASVGEVTPPPRTELVLLNVPEGSGWVAYRRDAAAGDVEDYRIVVIRQSTDELIYDSVIPLAASMATHGFELAKDDPRLKDLAENVDQNIISPLEQVVPELAAAPEEEPVTAPLVQTPPPAEVASVPEPAVIPEPTVMPEPTAMPEPTPTPLPEPVMVDSDVAYLLLQRNGKTLKIGMPKGTKIASGDRFFVREADRLISLPGSDEQVLVSKGTVTGLLEVVSVKGRVATTTLLSGYLPENAQFEPNE